jgi:hypothetical protein
MPACKRTMTKTDDKKSGKSKPDKRLPDRLIAENRRARYDYFIEERFEAGSFSKDGRSNPCAPARRRWPRPTSI